jgi:DNA-directed RNA polymerase specialized sigma24 family protein
MSKSDKTYIGGRNEAFHTTQWLHIDAAQTLDPQRKLEMIGTIMNKYWKPVYSYLRRKGNSNDLAKDLTQGFFHEVVLGRELISQADQTKGRFRTLLLTALDRYVVSMHRSKTAKKRAPQQPMVALDSFDPGSILDPVDSATPSDAFTYTWASQLLGEVIDAVEEECLRDGLEKHWKVFHATVVKPTMEGTSAPPLRELCSQLDIESETKASNMTMTVKRRFRAVLARCVRQYVESDDQVDEEIQDLMQILSKNRAG